MRRPFSDRKYVRSVAIPGVYLPSGIRHAIDPAIFHPEPRLRTRQIAAVPTKRPAELRQLIDVLTEAPA